MIRPLGMGHDMVGSKWKTPLLVFSLAVTMSSAVLAAGGIGVSRLDRPVSTVPPAPTLSPFRVVAGVPVTPQSDLFVPAPVVAPAESAPQAASVDAAESEVRPRPGPAARPAVRPPVAAPRAPEAARPPAPRPAPPRGQPDDRPAPAPTGGGRSGEPVPGGQDDGAKDDGGTASPDAKPSDDESRRGNNGRGRYLSAGEGSRGSIHEDEGADAGPYAAQGREDDRGQPGAAAQNDDRRGRD